MNIQLYKRIAILNKLSLFIDFINYIIVLLNYWLFVSHILDLIKRKQFNLMTIVLVSNIARTGLVNIHCSSMHNYKLFLSFLSD